MSTLYELFVNRKIPIRIVSNNSNSSCGQYNITTIYLFLRVIGLDVRLFVTCLIIFNQYNHSAVKSVPFVVAPRGELIYYRVLFVVFFSTQITEDQTIILLNCKTTLILCYNCRSIQAKPLFALQLLYFSDRTKHLRIIWKCNNWYHITYHNNSHKNNIHNNIFLSPVFCIIILSKNNILMTNE